MSREKGIKNKMRTPREKEMIILEYVNGNQGYKPVAKKHGIDSKQFHNWIKNYQKFGIKGFVSQTGKKPGGTKGQGARKPKNEEERLQRKIIKLEIEIARLKKGYLVKGDGVKKEYVTTLNKNMK